MEAFGQKFIPPSIIAFLWTIQLNTSETIRETEILKIIGFRVDYGKL